MPYLEEQEHEEGVELDRSDKSNTQSNNHAADSTAPAWSGVLSGVLTRVFGRSNNKEEEGDVEPRYSKDEEEEEEEEEEEIMGKKRQAEEVYNYPVKTKRRISSVSSDQKNPSIYAVAETLAEDVAMADKSNSNENAKKLAQVKSDSSRRSTGPRSPPAVDKRAALTVEELKSRALPPPPPSPETLCRRPSDNREPPPAGVRPPLKIEKSKPAHKGKTPPVPILPKAQQPIYPRIPPPSNIVLTEEQLAQHLESTRRQVMSAVSSVARVLQQGPWPSVERKIDPESLASHDAETSKRHWDHASIVGASLNQFVSDVILPAMLDQARHALSSQGGSINAAAIYRETPRAFLGTMLLLREVLMQNFDSIFGPSGLLTGLEEDCLTESITAEDMAQHVEENALFSAQVLSTAVILHAIQMGTKRGAETILQEFLRAMDAYDFGADEFARHMEPVTRDVTPMPPSREPLDEKEQLAWIMSYNFHRDRHVVIQRNRQRKFSGEVDDGAIRIPQVTTAHISILQAKE